MSNNRKAFNFYRSYYDVGMMLDPADRLQFFQAIMEIQFGIEPKTELSKMAMIALVGQQHSIDKQLKGYNSMISNKVIHHPGRVNQRPSGYHRATLDLPCLQEEGKEEGKEQVKEKVQEKEQDEGQDLEQCKQVSLKDQAWVRKAKVTDLELEAFNDHLILQGISSKAYIDYKRHFVNWKRKNPKELLDLSKQNRDDSW